MRIIINVCVCNYNNKHGVSVETVNAAYVSFDGVPARNATPNQPKIADSSSTGPIYAMPNKRKTADNTGDLYASVNKPKKGYTPIIIIIPFQKQNEVSTTILTFNAFEPVFVPKKCEIV